LDRISVGVGMIPRGEVGLIFASIGRTLGVVDDALYAATVVMVIVTTFVTPPALKITMAAYGRRQRARAR
ncbi:MAG: cation:proton antiporter, partial [Candidatus Rokuibacteriota bacterium]